MKPLTQLQAVQAGHADIRDNNVRFLGFRKAEGVPPIGGGACGGKPQLRPGNGSGQHFYYSAFIVGNDNTKHSFAPL